MSRKDQEEILDSLIISVKAKRLEESNLQKELDKILEMKSKHLDRIERLQSDIVSLEKKKGELSDTITRLSYEHDKIMTAAILKEEAITASEKKLLESREYLRKERVTVNKDLELIRSKHAEFKTERSKLDEIEKQSIRDKDKLRLEVKSFEKQQADFDKVKSEYKAKLNKIGLDQTAAIKNLEKSEELKSILNARIKENEQIRSRLNEESRNFTIAMKRLEADRVSMENAYALAMKEAVAQKDEFITKLKLQQALDNDIEIKRLRLEKLIREKGVAKELAELEKELNG